MVTIEAAIELLEAGKRDAALAILLTEWRTLRDPALADAIEAVGARIDEEHERPTGKTITQKDAAWHDLAEANEPADTGVLLATLDDVAKGAVLEGRIEALATRPSDPRIAKRLAELIIQMPVVGATGVDAMRLALDEIERIGDVRTIPLLEERRDRPRGGTVSWAASAYVHARLNDSIARVRVHAKPAAALDGLERIHALVAPDPTHAANQRELYAAVYADPDDDGPRLVLADVLQHRGDRRGEFIALQLERDKSREAQSREAELLRTYGREWIGPIEPAVKRSGVKFERGFLAKCAVHKPEHAPEAVLSAREWATLVDVDFEKWSSLATDLATRMPALRTAHGLTRMFESHPTLVEASLDHFTQQDLAKLSTLEAPAFRTLRIKNCAIASPEPFRPLWGTRMGQQIDHFGIITAYPAQWIVELRPRVRVLEVESWSWRYRFEGDELAISYGQPHHIPPDSWGALAEVLERLPTNITRHVKLPTIAHSTNRVAAAVKRFT